MAFSILVSTWSTSHLCYVQCECYFLFFGDGCTWEMAADLKLVIKRWEVNKKQSFSTWCTVKIVTSSLVKKINRRKIIAYIFTCHNNRFFLSNKHSDLLLTMGLFYFLWNVPAFSYCIVFTSIQWPCGCLLNFLYKICIGLLSALFF